MRKDFQTNTQPGCFAANMRYFFERQLAGQHNPGKTLFCCPPDTSGIMDSELCGGVKRQQWHNVTGKRNYPDILDEDCINTNRIEPLEILCNPLKFTVMDERVQGYINTDIKAVSETNRFFNFSVREIPGKFPGSKPLPAQVHCIGTRGYWPTRRAPSS